MPNYTKIPQEFKEDYHAKFTNIDKSQIPKLAEEDPVIFAYYFLGKKLRLHQAYIIDRILHSDKNRIAMCLSRQLGKSIMFAVFSIWASWYNKFPATISNLTNIYIISRDDEASMELLEKIRSVLHDGDAQMIKYYGKDDFFTGSLKEPNNTHQITFLNNCPIKSIPPTEKILGKSASIVFIDEAHNLNCEDPDKFFNKAVVPTTAETGGMIILSSTPNGIVGFFYEAIDPEGKKENNPYDSIWFDYKVWNDGTEKCRHYQEFVESEKQRMGAEGKIKLFQQEYEALFTVTETAFFEHKDVEDALDDTPQRYEWKETPCSLGIDYGLKTSRTVLTIRTMIMGQIIQLFQYRCSAGMDTNFLISEDWEHSIQNLKKRYNLFMIIVDDSPPGDTINRWIQSRTDVQVHMYNFRSDQMSKTDGINRNCAAYSYRAKLKEGVLKIPRWNTVQQFEMKIVQETEQKVLISIKAPTGHLCDTFDSDMMACIPFLDMSANYDFEVDSLEEKEDSDKIRLKQNNRRFIDPDAPKELTDEEIKTALANGDYETLAYR